MGDASFAQLAERAKVLRESIDISASDIMKFIYNTFPEIGTLSFDQAILP